MAMLWMKRLLCFEHLMLYIEKENAFLKTWGMK
jgi:hypothetical protein